MTIVLPMKFVVFSFLLTIIYSKIILQEDFADEGWSSRWIHSKKPDTGKFIIDVPKSSVSQARKLKSSMDAKFYHLLTKFPDGASLSTEKSTLYFGMTVQFEQDIDCGGGYVKLVPCTYKDDLDSFDGSTEYSIMFGPDICGPSNQHVHVILNYNGTNHLIRDKINIDNDALPHYYELIVKPDKKFEVLIDGSSKKSGDIESEWEIFPEPEIFDPEDVEPKDWVHEEEIDDPNDKKPDDYDQPEYIADAKAKKPEDWNIEEDGEWEPPQIANPDFKGVWEPKKIKNPAYKGPYERRKIPNPSYFKDPKLAQYDICLVGFDLWQVKSGTLFGGIIVTDDETEFKEFSKKQIDANQELRDAIDKTKDEERAEMEKKRKLEEEEEKTRKEQSKETDEGDDKKPTDDSQSSSSSDHESVKSTDHGGDFKPKEEL